MTELLFVVWSVKHSRWWEARGRGYTESLAKAGRYTAAECDKIEGGSQRARRFDQISVRIPVSAVEAAL
jgi:hypothetical protein